MSAASEQERTEENGPASKLLRLQADFENYRRRNANLTQQTRVDTQKEVFTELLPIRDNLLRALAHLEWDPAVREGIESILNQLDGIFSKFGVEEVDAGAGQSFDPAIHEAAAALPIGEVGVPEDAQPNTIAQELQKGYALGDSVLRPAQVQVYVAE